MKQYFFGNISLALFHAVTAAAALAAIYLGQTYVAAFLLCVMLVVLGVSMIIGVKHQGAEENLRPPEKSVMDRVFLRAARTSSRPRR